MIILRVASATAAVLLCVTTPAAAAVIEAQYRLPTEQTAPATPKPAAEPKAAPSSDREPRVKERTPPPRPIVPPEGQQQNPALREECAWIGQRIVSLLLRDDPMTGNDFMPFYQRFGCPPEYLSKAFACVVGSRLRRKRRAGRARRPMLDRSGATPAVAPAAKPEKTPEEPRRHRRPSRPTASK